MKDTLLALVRFLFSSICHQLPGHCLHYEGRALPLCARCVGTYLGILSALLTLWAMGQGRRGQFPPWRLRAFGAVLAFLWGLDGANSLAQWVFGAPLLYEPRNGLRLATGMGFGLTIGVALYPLYHLALWRRVVDKPVLERERNVIGLLLIGASWIIAFLAWRSAPFALWVIVASLAVFVALSVVNGTLIALLLHKEGFADIWLKVVPYLLAGLVAALVEMSALGMLHQLVPSVASGDGDFALSFSTPSPPSANRVCQITEPWVHFGQPRGKTCTHSNICWSP